MKKNKKILDIFITHWNEAWEIGKDMFGILALQRGINWDGIGVTIIHDGSDAFPEEYFSSCPFTVNQVCLPHGGVSAARNYAIDHSDAVWIKFCDFDDMFLEVYSILSIVYAIQNCTEFDMVWFPMIIDSKDTQFVSDTLTIFIHDKIFRTSFLNREHIRFNEDLTYSEDFAFTTMVEMIAGPNRIGKIQSNFPIYIYISREGSVVNRPDFWLKNKSGLFDAHVYIEAEIRKRGHWNKANMMVARTLAECLYVINSAPEDVDIDALVNRMKEYYRTHKGCLSGLNEDEWNAVIFATNAQNHCDITIKDISEWMKGVDDE